jgi:membrane-bound ClpP family serine protease
MLTFKYEIILKMKESFFRGENQEYLLYFPAAKICGHSYFQWFHNILYMKIIVNLLFFLPNLLYAEVIYEKLGFTDIDGREVVSLRIDGSIESDDEIIFDEALADINQNNYRVQFDSVILNSPGGVIYSAKQIGRLIRGNHLSTWVMPHDECSSACVLILQAGVCKMANGEVGIHRAKYEEDIPLE